MGEGESVRYWLQRTCCALIKGSMPGNGALWFLVTIFIVRSISECVLPKVHPLVAAFVSMILAFVHYSFATPHTPWYLGNVFSGFCFFSLGNYLKDFEKKFWVLAIGGLVYGFAVVAYLSGLFEFPYLYMHKNVMHNGNYLLFYPIALSGIIVTNNLFRKVYDYWKFPVLSYVGRNAMNFYVTHWIVLVVAQFVFSYQLKIQSPKFLCLLYALSCVVVLPIINYLINLTKNRKNV